MDSNQVESDQNLYNNFDQSKEKYGTQCLVSVAASLSALLIGLHLGWMASTLPLLTDINSPVPVSNSESAWVSGCLQIGVIIAAPIVSLYATDKFGRQKAMLIGAWPSLISFALIYFATNVWMLYLARIICGITVATAYVAVPIYITEISSAKIRGILGMFFGCGYPLGMLIEYLIVPLVSIKMNALICCVISACVGIIVFFLPDTPYFYIMNNNYDLAEKTLKFLRQKDDVTQELEILKNGWEMQKKEGKISILDTFRTKLNRKCLFIVFGILFGQQFAGNAAFMTYMIEFLKQSGMPISENTLSLIIVILHATCPLFTTALIDRFGRKTLLTVSAIGTGFCLVIIGVFYYLQSINFDHTSNINFIPFVGMLIYTVTLSIGLGGLPYIVTSEIFAVKYKATAGTIVTVFGSVLGLIVIQLYELLSENFGLEYSFWCFAICCFIAATFFIMFVPETKGKTLEKIQLDLQATFYISG